MQELKIPNTNMALRFTEDVEIIPKKDLDDLVKQSTLGKIVKIDDVATHLNTSRRWVEKNILNNPRFADDLEKMKKQGIVIKTGRTAPWKFQASKFYAWLDLRIPDFKDLWGSTANGKN
ncbi:DUF771 domain-containing protein [Limosilactobacillus oris]|uniref:DUF771 domain-containing protein n=1 Tax=Limosilactobacillus oris TaxID=1632 RepID=UPI00195D45C6|nr:DUF771 domain-containing protein [Limosilactobacillus oris]VTX69843.1 Uncharacterised protein [Limosilactobacillus oris]